MNRHFQNALHADPPDWEGLARQLIDRPGQLDNDDIFAAVGRLFEFVGELQPLLDLPLTRAQLPSSLMERLTALEAEGIEPPSFPITMRALLAWLAAHEQELEARPSGMRP